MHGCSRSTSVPRAAVSLFEVEYDGEMLGEIELFGPGIA
jgi:hypothetical protein